MNEDLNLIAQSNGIWLKQPISDYCRKGLHLYHTCESHEIWEFIDANLYILFWPPCGVYLNRKKGIRQFLVRLKDSPDLWDVGAITTSQDPSALANSLILPVIPYQEWVKRQIVVDDLTIHQQLAKERQESLARHVVAYSEWRDLDLAAKQFKKTMRAAMLYDKGKPVTAAKFCHLLAAFGFWNDLSDDAKEYLLNDVDQVGKDGTVLLRGVPEPVENEPIAALAFTLHKTVTAVQLALGSTAPNKD